MGIFICDVKRNGEWIRVSPREVQDGELFKMYRNGELMELDGETEQIMKSLGNKNIIKD